MTIAESIQLNKEQIARAFSVPAHMLADPHRTVAPRYWSLCMTSENHGTVGLAGCKFTHAPDKHERVLVVEVPAAPGAGSTARPDWLEYDPADHILTIYGVKYSGDLFSGLGLGPVGMSFTILAREDGSLTLCRGPVAAQAGPTVLTDERVERIWDETVTADAETLKEVRMRFARAVARDVAAQAGQVAVPEGFKLVPVEATLEMVTKGFESAPDEFFSPTAEWEAYAAMTGCQKAAHRARLCYAAMLAAAPTSPAQASPAPAQTQPPKPTECWSVNEEGFSHDSLAELLDCHPELKAGSRVFVGEAVHPALNRLIDSDDVIDQMGDRADDIAGEYADGYPDVSVEDKAELDMLLAAWIAKSCPPTFYEVKNVRAYVITEQDIPGAQASTSGERQEGGAA